MKTSYVLSFLLGVSIWFNILSYLDYVDRKVVSAYDEGYERGKLHERLVNLQNSIENRIDNIKRDLSQTPGK